METRPQLDSDMLVQGDNGISLYPKIDSQPVGFSAAEKTPTYVEIKHFIVCDDGLGVGTRMLLEIEDWAKQNNLFFIQMHFTEEIKGKPMPKDKVGLKQFLLRHGYAANIPYGVSKKLTIA